MGGQICWSRKWPNWNRFIHHHLSRKLSSSLLVLLEVTNIFLYPDKKIHRFLIWPHAFDVLYNSMLLVQNWLTKFVSYYTITIQKPNNWWFMSPKGQNHDEERKYKNWKEKRALLKNQADISYLLVQFNCALLLAIM